MSAKFPRVVANENALIIPIPLADGPAVALVVGVDGAPMTEAGWDQFMAVLNAMKPGLVKDGGS